MAENYFKNLDENKKNQYESILSKEANINKLSNIEETNPIIKDSQNNNISNLEFFNKYGLDKYSVKENLPLEQDFEKSRNSEELTLDSLINVGDASTGILLSAGQIGYDILNKGPGIVTQFLGPPDLGDIKLIELENERSNFFNNLRSDTIRNRQEIQQQINDVRKIQREINFEANKKTDGELLANFKKLGQTVIDGIDSGSNDPLGSISSLVGSVAGYKKLLKTVPKSLQNQTIGVMEGGISSKNEIISSIMEIPTEVLKENSSRFNELINTGLNEENARIQLALEEGNKAFGIGSVTGSIISKLTGGTQFEKSFGIPKENLFKTLGGEVLEEGSFGGLTTSLIKSSEKENINPEINVLDEALFSGIESGTSAAIGVGLLNAPNMTGKTAIAGTKAGLSVVWQGLQNRVDKRQEQQDLNTITESLNNVDQSINELSNEDKKIKAQELIFGSMLINELDEKTTSNISDSLIKNENNQTDVFSSLQNIANKINNNEFEENSTQEIQALLFLKENTDKLNNSIVEARNLNIEDQDFDNFSNNLINALTAIKESKSVSDGLQKLENIDFGNLFFAQENYEPTEESNALVNKIFDLFPNKAMNIIVNNIRNGKHTWLNKDLEKKYNDLQKLNTINEEAQQQKEKLLKDNNNSNNDDIDVNNNKNPFIDNRTTNKTSKEVYDEINIGGGEKRSILEYFNELSNNSDKPNYINTEGEIVTPQETLQDFGNFAQHMKNKAEALNESYNNGGTNINYDTYDGSSWFRGDKGLSINVLPNNANSVNNAKANIIDANKVIESYNQMIDQFGNQLGITNKIELPTVNDNLNPKSKVKTKQIIQKEESEPVKKKILQLELPIVNDNLSSKPKVKTKQVIQKQQPKPIKKKVLQLELPIVNDNLSSKPSEPIKKKVLQPTVKQELKKQDIIKKPEIKKTSKEIPVTGEKRTTKENISKKETTNKKDIIENNKNLDSFLNTKDIYKSLDNLPDDFIFSIRHKLDKEPYLEDSDLITIKFTNSEKTILKNAGIQEVSKDTYQREIFDELLVYKGLAVDQGVATYIANTGKDFSLKETISLMQLDSNFNKEQKSFINFLSKKLPKNNKTSIKVLYEEDFKKIAEKGFKNYAAVGGFYDHINNVVYVRGSNNSRKMNISLLHEIHHSFTRNTIDTYYKITDKNDIRYKLLKNLENVIIDSIPKIEGILKNLEDNAENSDIIHYLNYMIQAKSLKMPSVELIEGEMTDVSLSFNELYTFNNMYSKVPSIAEGIKLSKENPVSNEIILEDENYVFKNINTGIIHEFLAVGLSDPEIIKILKKEKLSDQVKKILLDILNSVLELIGFNLLPKKDLESLYDGLNKSVKDIISYDFKEKTQVYTNTEFNKRVVVSKDVESNAELKDKILNQEFKYKLSKVQRENIIKNINNFINGFNRYFNSIIKPKDLSFFNKKPDTQQLALLHLYDQNSKKLDNEIIGKASLAMLDWLLNVQPNNFPDFDNTVISSQELFENYNGVLATTAIEKITNNLFKYLNVKENENIPENKSRGFIELLGKQLLNYIIKNTPYISTRTIITKDIDNDGKTVEKRHLVIDFNIEAIKKFKENYPEATSIFRDIINNKDVDFYSVGSKIEEIKTNQIRSKTKITKKQEIALKIQQDTPYKKLPFFDFVNKFQGLAKYLGADVNFKKYNKFHALSVDGKNLSINSNILNSSQVQDSLNNSEDNSVYFPIQYTSVNRGQQSSGSPQNNKLLREMVFPQTSIISFDNQKVINDFWKTIAQATDVFKPEKNGIQTAINNAEKLVREKYGDAINYLVENFDKETIPEEFLLNMLSDVIGSKEAARILHGVYSAAAHDIALRDGKKSFETGIHFEIDGVTNGLFNLMAMFTTEFNDETLSLLNKGGMLFDGINTLGPIGEYYENLPSNNKLDIYGTYASKLSKNLQIILNITQNSPIKTKEDEIGLNILKLVSTFVDKFDFNNEDVDQLIQDQLDIDRGFTKNPSTQIGYGAGIKAISKSIAKQIINSIYQDRTNKILGKEHFKNLKELLSNSLKNKIIQVKGIIVVVNNTNFKDINFFNDKEFEINQLNEEALTNNIAFALGETLHGVVSSSLGSGYNNLQYLITLTNLQSEIASTLFTKEIEETIFAQRELGKIGKTDLLSKKDYNKILNKYLKLLPNYQGTNFNLSLGETNSSAVFKTKTKEIEVTDKEGNKTKETIFVPESLSPATLDDQLRLPSNFQGIEANIGAAIAPNLTISSGDGSTITNYYSDPEVQKNEELQKVTQTFDGVHVPVHLIDKVGNKLNESNFNAFLVNHYRPILDNWQFFLSNLKLIKPDQLIYDNMSKKISEANSKLGYDENTKPSDLLQDWVLQTEGRIKTYKQLNISLDQMAGSTTPYINNGGNTITNAEELNELVKLNRPDYDPTKIVENEKLKKKIKKTTYSISEFVNLFFGTDISKEEYAVLNQVKNFLSDSGYTIHISENINELNKILKEQYPNYKNKVTQKGLILPNERAIFINNFSNETSVHELLHAGTTYSLYDYYVNGNKDGKYAQNIKLLESLMFQFFKTKFNDNTNIAVPKVKAYINNIKEHDPLTKVTALSEFISWTLTNNRLKYQTKKIKTSKGFQKIFNENTLVSNLIDKTMNIIKKFFNIGSKRIDNLYDSVLFNTIIIMENQQNINNLNIQEFEHDDKLNFITDKLNNFIKTSKDVNDALKKTDTFKFMQKNLEKVLQLNNFNYSDPIKQQKYVDSFLTTHYGLENKLINYSDITNIFNQLFDSLAENDLGSDYDTLLNSKEPINSKIANLLALYNSDNQFKNIIGSKKLKLDKINYQNLNQYLTDVTDKILKQFTAKNYSVNQSDNFNQIINTINNFRNDKKSDILNKKFSIIDNEASNVIQNTVNKLYKNDGSFKDSLLKLLDKNVRSQEKEFYLKFLNTQNKIPKPIKQLIKEIVGKTPGTEKIEDMLKIVKFFVSNQKEEIKEQIPKIIRNSFNKEMKIKDWKTLTSSILDTDLVSIGSIKDIKNSINNINKSVSDLENKINDKDKIKKAKQLANYMVTGKAGIDLMTNAYAINLYAGKSKANEKDIDQLISLYAYNLLDNKTKNDFKVLLEKESNGIETIINTVNNLKKKENEKYNSESVKLNSWKNYYKKSIIEDGRLVLGEVSKEKELLKRGYVKIGEYKNNLNSKTQAYYYNPLSESKYAQGILQTVKNSVNGVDPITGKTLNRLGHVRNSQFVSRFVEGNRLDSNENFIPRFNNNGLIYGYDILPNAQMNQKIKYEYDTSLILGDWQSRQLEENLRDEYNNALIDELYKNYNKNEPEQYINLATSENLLHKDIWNVIPIETKNYIQSVFGKDKFFIRKDIFDNVVGYREASIKDIFTGNTDLSDNTVKGMQEILISLFGSKAINYLSKTEDLIKTGVQQAKQTIIIKSGIVSVGNVLSNIIQLMNNGVSIIYMKKTFPIIFREFSQYDKNRKEIIKLTNQLTNPNLTKNKLNQIQNKINLLEQNNKSFKYINPILNAGEYSTIAEDVSDLDIGLFSRETIEKIQDKVNELHPSILNFGKNVLITKDTALYKGLFKFAQYGDLISKAVLYNDLVENKNKSNKEALSIMSEEFVNYDFNSGRTRDYLESIGLLWFWKFKLRSVKVAERLLLDNPLRSLMSNILVNELDGLSVGSPQQDNIISKLFSEGIGHTIGPEMALNSYKLHPAGMFL